MKLTQLKKRQKLLSMVRKLTYLYVHKKVVFLEAGFYPANQSNLKSFCKALIGWNKAAL